MTTKGYILRWLEWNNTGTKQLGKEKEFSTEEQMQKFIAKIEEKDNFYKILAYGGKIA